MINWKSINKCRVAKSLNGIQRFKSLVIGRRKKNSTTGIQTSHINKLLKPASSLINTNHFNNIATHTTPAVKNYIHFIGNQIIFGIPDQKIFLKHFNLPLPEKKIQQQKNCLIKIYYFMFYYFYYIFFSLWISNRLIFPHKIKRENVYIKIQLVAQSIKFIILFVWFNFFTWYTHTQTTFMFRREK